jgi:hypothetical protein
MSILIREVCCFDDDEDIEMKHTPPVYTHNMLLCNTLASITLVKYLC